MSRVYSKERVEELRSEIFSHIDSSKVALEDIFEKSNIDDATYELIMSLWYTTTTMAEIFVNFLDEKEVL